MKSENQPKAAVSVSAQCRLLKMSRSQFYWHVKQGTFHAPLKLPNGRPYFTASMVEDNLRARESGVTVTGEYVIFYERQPTSTKIEIKRVKNDLVALIEGLKALGLGTVTKDQVETALATCFPELHFPRFSQTTQFENAEIQGKSWRSRISCVCSVEA